MKKILFLLLVLGMALYSSAAFGAWGNYYVKSTGPYESSSFPSVGQIMAVQLEPVGGGSASYFRIDADVENELLAVALTAVSTGQPIRANIEVTHSNGHWSDYSVLTMFIYDQEASLP
jgi:hypothetical protein